MKPEHFLTLYKTYIRPKYKTLRRKHRQNTLWHKSLQVSLWPTSQSNGKKNKQWDLIKLKSFCTKKETVSKVKIQPSEMEKIRANETTDKELISKIYKQLTHLTREGNGNPLQYSCLNMTEQLTCAAQQQKNKQPNQKVGRRPKQTFLLSKKTYRWLINTWKDAQHHSLIEKFKSKSQMMYHLTPFRKY